jgi:hypothetical protein
VFFDTEIVFRDSGEGKSGKEKVKGFYPFSLGLFAFNFSLALW